MTETDTFGIEKYTICEDFTGYNIKGPSGGVLPNMDHMTFRTLTQRMAGLCAGKPLGAVEFKCSEGIMARENPESLIFFYEALVQDRLARRGD